MPRYRFNWSNLDMRLARALRDHLQLSGEPHEALRAVYGARPRPDFVRDTWQVLRDSWLARDKAAARLTATRLRQRGVGDVTVRNDVQFLGTVRNTTGMRQIVLELFIEHGEQSADDRSLVRAVSVATADTTDTADTTEDEPHDEGPDTDADAGGSEPDEEDLPESMLLMMYLLQTLSEGFRVEVNVDADGDLYVQVGSAVVYVSVLPEPLCVRIFSVMVVDVPDAPDVYQLINSVNCTLRLGRLVYVNGAVLLEHHLLPMGLNGQEVLITVDSILATADHLDDQIQQRVGGRTALLQPAEDEIDV